VAGTGLSAAKVKGPSLLPRGGAPSSGTLRAVAGTFLGIALADEAVGSYSARRYRRPPRLRLAVRGVVPVPWLVAPTSGRLLL